MAATAAQLATLKRYTNEDGAGDVYTDVLLTSILESYPVSDADGNEPDESDWTATYDLHAAAAQIWGEKATAHACKVDANMPGGGSYRNSQLLENAQRLEKYHNARARARGTRFTAYPKPTEDRVWVGNLAEETVE